MSSEAMAWAKRCGEVGSVPQLVLMLMADWADHEDKAWPGVKTLAAMTSRSERTIIRAVKRLEEAGLIEKSTRTVWCALDNPACLSKGPHKHRTSNLYRLKVGAVPILPTKGRAVPGAKEGESKGDKMSLMKETAESCGNPISDKMSLLSFNSDISGRSIVTPVSPVCNRDTLEDYPPDPTQPSPPAGVAPSADPGSGPVGSGAIQEDLSASTGVLGSADADAEAATARGERAAEMLASGENPASMVASGLWDAQQLAKALAWVAEHPAPARAPETTQQRQEVAPQAVRREHDHVDEASALIGACLPTWMQAMDRSGARQVAAMLAERISAGWKPAEVRGLMGEKPTTGVRRMSGLVVYRLDENVGIHDAPQARTAAARQAQEAEIEAAHLAQDAAIEAAAEAAKTPEERARETAHTRMWERMRAEHPQASKAELVALVRDALTALA